MNAGIPVIHKRRNPDLEARAAAAIRRRREENNEPSAAWILRPWHSTPQGQSVLERAILRWRSREC